MVTYIVMFNIHARMLCELETVSHCVDESNFFSQSYFAYDNNYEENSYVRRLL